MHRTNKNNFFQIVLIVLGISSFAAMLASYCLWKKAKITLSPRPEKWVKVGNVSNLIIYPIKSCHGGIIETGVVTQLGLKALNGKILDRLFMVVDEAVKQVTMLKFPKMSLIRVEFSQELDDTRITLSAPEMQSITLKIPEPNGKNKRI